MKKIGFIGMGNMASAILRGIRSASFIDGHHVIAYDINSQQLEKVADLGINFAENAEDLVVQSDIILIAVKPQVVEDVIKPLKEKLKDKAIISIVLGYDFARYNQLLDSSTRHIFVMPNTPVQVLEGMSLIEASHSLKDDEFIFTKELFSSIGEIEVVPSHLMKVGGALSGCSPAYIYMIIEAIADGAVKQGMPRKMAYKLASQTVLGSGKMQRETGLHPGVLKDNVCSPGGSTIKGVHALEKGNIRSIFINAIEDSMMD